MEVDKAQIVVETHLVYLLEGCEQFCAGQAELRNKIRYYERL